MNTFDIVIPYVEIRNKSRELIGIIEGAEIYFEYNFHGSGEFEIYCRATEENIALLKIDNYVTLPVNADSTIGLIEKNSNMWIIEKIHRNNSKTGGRWITASGREAKQILDRRIIPRTQTLKNTKSLVEQIKTDLIEPNMCGTYIDNNGEYKYREVEGFSVGYTDKAQYVYINDETQVSYANLFDYVEELYLTYGMGGKLRLNRADNKMLYTIYKGEDKTNSIVFSIANENLLSNDYTEDWSTYKTYALIGGAELEAGTYLDTNGDTVNVPTILRLKSTVDLSSDIDNPLSDIDRREVFVDAKDLAVKVEDTEKTIYPLNDQNSNYYLMLKERGRYKLASESNKKVEFDGEIDVTNEKYKFNTDYYLGDIVSIRDDDIGKSFPVRVSKFVKVQNDEGYREYFEYETYELTRHAGYHNLTIRCKGEENPSYYPLEYNINGRAEENWVSIDNPFNKNVLTFDKVQTVRFRLKKDEEKINSINQTKYNIRKVSGTTLTGTSDTLMTSTLLKYQEEDVRLLTLRTDTVLEIEAINFEFEEV